MCVSTRHCESDLQYFCYTLKPESDFSEAVTVQWKQNLEEEVSERLALLNFVELVVVDTIQIA